MGWSTYIKNEDTALVNSYNAITALNKAYNERADILNLFKLPLVNHLDLYTNPQTALEKPFFRDIDYFLTRIIEFFYKDIDTQYTVKSIYEELGELKICYTLLKILNFNISNSYNIYSIVYYEQKYYMNTAAVSPNGDVPSESTLWMEVEVIPFRGIYDRRWFNQTIKVFNKLTKRFIPWYINGSVLGNSLNYTGLGETYSSAVSNAISSVPDERFHRNQTAIISSSSEQYSAYFETSYDILYNEFIFSSRGNYACEQEIYFYFKNPAGVFDGAGIVTLGRNKIDTILPENFNNEDYYKWKWDARDYVPADGGLGDIYGRGYALDFYTYPSEGTTKSVYNGGIFKNYKVIDGFEFVEGS